MVMYSFTLPQFKLSEPDPRQETSQQYKDRLFRHLFSDTQRAIELYNAVTGNSCPLNTPIELMPANALVARWNDVAFTIDSRLVAFFEHQSTPNVNMPIRLLQYFSSLLNEFPEIYRELHGNKKIQIPTPEFYMLYNGNKNLTYRTLRLSDSFMTGQAKPRLELIVQVVDIRYNRRSRVIKKSATLRGYAYLVSEIEMRLRKGMARDKAIKAAVDQCIKRSILTDYLNANYTEVLMMLNMEYDADLEREVVAEQAREEGREEEREVWQEVVADKDAAIAELADAIAEQADAIAVKDTAIARQATLIAELQAKLGIAG